MSFKDDVSPADNFQSLNTHSNHEDFCGKDAPQKKKLRIDPTAAQVHTVCYIADSEEMNSDRHSLEAEDEQFGQSDRDCSDIMEGNENSRILKTKKTGLLHRCCLNAKQHSGFDHDKFKALIDFLSDDLCSGNLNILDQPDSYHDCDGQEISEVEIVETTRKI